MHGLNEDSAKLDHSVNYLASGYTVSKHRIELNFSDEEKTRAMSQLETDFNSAVILLADRTAKELGGFFEEKIKP